MFTSDDSAFGGGGVTNGKSIMTIDEPMHGCEQCVELTLPANTVFFLECTRPGVKPKPKAVKKEKPKPAIVTYTGRRADTASA